MLLLRLQRHQIHHIDQPYPEFGYVLPQKLNRSQCFKGWNIPSASQHDVRLSVLVIACPAPDPDSSRTVLYSGIQVKPLKLGLLPSHDNVNEIARTQALVGDEKKGIDVGRKIDTDDIRFLVDDMIAETWILMRKAVVILLPHMRCQQIIE